MIDTGHNGAHTFKFKLDNMLSRGSSTLGGGTDCRKIDKSTELKLEDRDTHTHTHTHTHLIMDIGPFLSDHAQQQIYWIICVLIPKDWKVIVNLWKKYKETLTIKIGALANYTAQELHRTCREIVKAKSWSSFVWWTFEQAMVTSCRKCNSPKTIRIKALAFLCHQ